MGRSTQFTLLAVASVAFAGACNDTSRIASSQDPFAFAEMRELAAPLDQVDRAGESLDRNRLRENNKRLLQLYVEALDRFESIYGDGIGPAKQSPNYRECKAAFRQVENRIEILPAPDAELATLWATLKQCREVASQWTGAAEIATFGRDLRAMTDGSLLALSYVAAASGSSLGPSFHKDYQSLE